MQKLCTLSAAGMAPPQIKSFSLKPNMKLSPKQESANQGGLQSDLQSQTELAKKQQELKKFIIFKSIEKTNTALDFKQAKIDHFLGNWRKWGKWSGAEEGEAECAQDGNGWSNEELDSEYSDAEWMANKRPGMYDRGDSDEEAANDRWDDSDDDDHGGHMMPLPN